MIIVTNCCNMRTNGLNSNIFLTIQRFCGFVFKFKTLCIFYRHKNLNGNYNLEALNILSKFSILIV